MKNPSKTDVQQGDHRDPPAGTGIFGLFLFLLSLGVLFVASMVGYIIIRTTGTHAPAAGTLHVAAGFWISTAIMIVSSVTMHMAVGAIRRGNATTFKTAIILTALLAVAFLMVQAPNVYQLYRTHEASRADNVFLYGLAMLLIALHAAHVLGGLVPLGLVTAHALTGRYDADHHEGVRQCAMYWHFLDGVWVVMFAMFLLTA